jgi:hypothetical protein
MKSLEVSAVIEQLGIDKDSFREWVRSLPAQHNYDQEISAFSYFYRPWQPNCDKEPVTENR